MGQRRTDAKDLSPVPVAIGNRLELELKRKSQRDDADVQRLEAATDADHKYRHKRSKSRSRSLGRDDLPEDSERRHKKAKSRRNHPADDLTKDAKAPVNTSAPQGETEEEYDARLEREENERLAAERRRHLERFKQLDDTTPKDGIRFKGRGRMKFIDPEISQRQS
ncbi:hypothetical protein PC9H_009628 [Pleurotus ostreatus]|uniref:Uncharacterized protein n=3 Tax=Pleurotus TaxID=5320 RepID=A0A067NC91_PLEO1|nr:uncharacterized protein PC9H_009628 [Pleurotus ostreatus]KAF7424321.1 hypothetical protein PC9H_009628 [Pleurotus ostreatus]KAG9224775.1 hypothetical protein CCMSSC00406_0002074 [Pleurotus cornucopiae]KAJ8692772.1 hypothetical protein PTI98_010053 [Pleurotus ostreatus]KDQ24575.1 hypothetical protein PLEOSDRAFT_161386 [Pleurotus ostreatus PC15]